MLPAREGGLSIQQEWLPSAKRRGATAHRRRAQPVLAWERLNYLSSSFSISSFQVQYGVWSLTTESTFTRSLETSVHSERW